MPLQKDLTAKSTRRAKNEFELLCALGALGGQIISLNMKRLYRVAALPAVLFLSSCAQFERQGLFHPTHRPQTNGLTEWRSEGELMGYARIVDAPHNVWLLIHGNAGQAADRVYTFSAFSPHDSIFILEYPGYGLRPGVPSKPAFDAAAVSAYRVLRAIFPKTPVCVAGESIGSGPACQLATQIPPPDKVVLIVPFDDLKRVAAHHLPYFPVGFVLGRTWNNVQFLSGYKGPVDIYGMSDDRVIPVAHAKLLAGSLPQARFQALQGGHNDWSSRPEIKIRNP